MWIRRLKLKNLRSFAEAEIEFSKGINILIGPNNSGKSTILLPLFGLQKGFLPLSSTDVRLGETKARADMYCGGDSVFKEGNTQIRYECQDRHQPFRLGGFVDGIDETRKLDRISNLEPDNFIYPFLSKRKVSQLAEQINSKAAKSVLPNLENLNARIDLLSNAQIVPSHGHYMEACETILGFKVTAADTPQGKRAELTVTNKGGIPLQSMGEGVAGILGLLVNLVMAEKDRLFLIEEPENDIHPKALKALLDLIIDKSSSNQFIITTHSNIVLKRLGSSKDARVFEVDCALEDRVPTSTIREVTSSPEDRRKVLSELGYELDDVGLWSGWLFLEESSAEKIIREYLIPWFAPSLKNRLRTFSAHSASEVAPKFRDFQELFVFLHLEPTYKNRAWVVIDGGDEERKIIDKMKNDYTKSGWDVRRFRQFNRHDFEDYYPDEFRDDVEQMKSIKNKKSRQDEKKTLLGKVEAAIAANENALREAFRDSASEVIDTLKEIADELG